MENALEIRRQPVNPELCQRYAQFASSLDRWHFKIIYWTMFISNLLVLFMASWTYTRAQEALERFSPGTPQRKRRLRQSIMMCLGCVATSTTIVIMEAYAIMALQFCDGEDLISLYWSTWTMIQVGSLIAMVGIILALANTLRGRRHPPWTLALGTPVLVIAGLLHLFHECTKKRVKKQILKRMASRSEDGDGPSMSQANTIEVDSSDAVSEIRGEMIGFTVQGGPIIRFTDAIPGNLPNHAQLLGYDPDNKPVVIIQRDAVQFITEVPLQRPEISLKSFRKGSQ